MVRFLDPEIVEMVDRSFMGTELGNIIFSYLDDSKLRPSVSNCLGTQNLIFFVPV